MMNAPNGVPRLDTLARWLWAATLFTVPVTSFRYFPAGEGTYVRPLALFPLALLLITLAVQAVAGQRSLPRAGSLTPLTAFMLIALASSLLGLLLAPVPLRGQDIGARLIRAWITLLMGFGFFLGAIWMNRTDPEWRFSIRWLLAGFVLDVFWSGLQAATFYLELLPKPLVTQWQRMFSLRELIRTNRISGMAYEPSWLAGQIATVYLPWLLAAVLTRVRITRFRWLEPCLLVLACAMVVATYSRGGILTAAISVGLTLVLAGRSAIRAAWSWLIVGFGRGREAALRVGIITLLLASAVGVALLLAQKGYISRLWETRASDLSEFLVQNSAGARGAYLVSAMETYEDHPWTGVGLGGSGLYMYSRLPDWALTTVPEIARQLSPESGLYPNPKNLYLRLLAETGILGLLFYLAFQSSLLGDVVQALRRGAASWRFLGIAGLCTWLALLFYNLMQDSFATPNLWLNLGILAGVAGVGRQADAGGHSK
jgi:O-antigen ligase